MSLSLKFSGRRCGKTSVRRLLSTVPETAASRVIPTQPVCSPPDELKNNPEAFRDFVSSGSSVPLLFKHVPSQHDSRAETLIRALRKGEDRLVDVEVGRYDSIGQFDHVPMRLGQYLDWLESDERTNGTVGGHQLYLAQWRGNDELPEVAQLVKPPPLLAPLLSSGVADLYQTSFFIGPSNAVTPLHYDPYENLYHLHASSASSRCAKHFTLLPPSASEFLRRTDTYKSLHNTSFLDFCLRSSNPSSKNNEKAFDVLVDRAAPATSVDAISAATQSCILREGETLFIPKGWWHRVENVSLTGDDTNSQTNAGWSAGVGWWFLLRKFRQN